MSAPLVSSLAEARSSKGPFRLRYEYRGYNDDNASGRSSKFWEIEGTGGAYSVTIRWGKIGSAGQSQTKTWSEATEKAYEKEGKGYRLVKPAPKPAPKPAVTLTGPFAEIRLIKKMTDVAKAFDSAGNFVMDLTLEGADALLNTDPFRITVMAA